MGRSWGCAVTTAVAFFFVAAAFQMAPRPRLDGAALRAAEVAPLLDDILPFPAPAAAETPTSGFHTLPSLQCRRHGSGSGDSSGGDDRPSAARGPGWVLVANASARPVFIPYAPGTCAAPLTDAFQLQYLANPGHTDKIFHTSGASTHVDVGGDVRGEYEWAGNTLLSWGALHARDRAAVGGEVTADWFSPQPCAQRTSGPSRPSLLCEEQLVRHLGQHRGSRVGRVDRWVGVYDVAVITRGTLGWALDPRAYVVASDDTVSAAAGGDTPALVTYADGSGATRPVLVGEAGLLSLGRAALADPSWFGPSVPGGVHAVVKLQMTEGSLVQPRKPWKLHALNARVKGTSWLADVAYALCLPPVESFVADAGLCSGMPRRPPPPPVSLSADGKQVTEQLNLAAGPFQTFGHSQSSAPSLTSVSVRWQVSPPSGPVAPALPCNLPRDLKWYDKRRQPIWLLGRGEREVPRAGWSANPAEAELARRLGSCAYTDFRRDLTVQTKWPEALSDRAEALSQQYSREVFHVHPPAAPPASDTDLILAGLVVVPEAVALLLLLLQPAPPSDSATRAGRARHLTCAVLIVGAGLLSLLGVGFLDAQEHAGSSWRAAALRLETRIAANETEQASTSGQQIDYTGRQVWHVESLIMVARPGYRPSVTRPLFIGMSVAYGLLTGVVIAKGVWGWYIGRRAAAAATESPLACLKD